MRVLTAILLLLSASAVAQHVPLQSQYMFNPIALNPAFTGHAEALSAVGSYRAQWVGFEGAPSTEALTIHTPLKRQNSAVGFQLYADQITINRNIGVFGSYAYRLKFSNARLSLGIAGGVNFMRSYFSRLDVADNNDQTLIADSPLGILPEFSFGAHYYTDKYFVSLSVPMLLSHEFNGAKFKASNDFASYNYMLGGGYLFTLGNGFQLKPSVLTKYTYGSKVQADFNVMALLNDAFDVGLSYRTNEALVALVEVRPTQQFGFMYSFGYPLNPLGQYTYGSHELSLKYTMRYKTKIVGPRSLGW